MYTYVYTVHIILSHNNNIEYIYGKIINILHYKIEKYIKNI